MSASAIAKTTKRRLLGLCLIGVVVGFLAFTIMQFNQAFTPVRMVYLHTYLDANKNSIGSQMALQSDVKVHGVVVGQVRDITPTTNGATLELAIDPDKIDQIPKNVTAQLLPKSLFGERYVELGSWAPDGKELPLNTSAGSLAAGDTINQDHSKAATEVENAIDDLMPVLKAVRPQDLNATLTAVSTALHGRGKQLGNTLVQLGKYVKELQPYIPTLTHDLDALAQVSQTYSQALPNAVHALNDLTTTSQTIVDEQNNLENLYGSMITTSQDLGSFLQANENNLIQVTSNLKPTAQLLAKYSPEIPCVMSDFAKGVGVIDQVMGKGTNEVGLHTDLQITVQRGGYQAGKDTPQYNDHRGPQCYNDLAKNFTNPPNFPPQYPPGGAFNDGDHTDPPPARTSNTGVSPAGSSTGGTTGTTSPQSLGLGKDMGVPNSPDEQSFIQSLLASELGNQPQDIPSWASLLFGPLYRGAEVNVQ